MAAPHRSRTLSCPAWTPSYGRVRCFVHYRVRFVRERWRRLLALVFAALISLLVGAFIVTVEPIDSGIAVFMTGTVAIVGMTLIALIFGIEINDVTIGKDGATLNFGDSEDGDD